MKFSNNLKISAKISRAFTLINVIYIIGIIALIASYMMANDRLNTMNDEAVSPQKSISEIRIAILSERVAVEQLVLLKPGTSQFGYVKDVFNTENSKVSAYILEYSDYMAGYMDGGFAEEIRSYYENEYLTYIEQLISLAESDNDESATDLMFSSSHIEEKMDALLNSAEAEIEEKIDYFIGDARFGLIRLIIIAVIVVIFIIILIRSIIKHMQDSVSRRIEKVTGAANRLAAGDLEIDITNDSTDEIGQLTDSFLSMANSIKKQAGALVAVADRDLTVSLEPRSDVDVMNTAIKEMIENLNIILSQIDIGIEQVSVGANQIAQGSQALAKGAMEQASAVSELSVSIADVSQATHDNTAKAQEAAGLMDTVNSSAVQGTEQMNRMARAVEDINEASQSISKVIKVIDDIAFQTNILALNAAVEAARAGQYGRGFAVVAEEVRNLASKSAEAAKDTGLLIENSIEKATLGADIAHETVASFEQIVAGINDSAVLLNDIVRSSEQQSVAVRQINQGVDQVAAVVQENTATSEESAASSEELSEQAKRLDELVSKFRLKGQEAGTEDEPNQHTGDA